MPAAPAQARERAECHSLDGERDEPEVHLVEVLVEEDGDLEQRPGTQVRDPHPAVALKAEERP